MIQEITIKKKNAIYMINEHISTIFLKESILNFWKNSKFGNINLLKCDGVGLVGQKFIQQICNENDLIFKSTNQDYDFTIEDKRIVLRTSRLGISKTFQHENIKQHSCDFYIFLDVSPNEIYLTIVKSFDFRLKHPVLNLTPHLRKNTTNIFKLDFSYKKMETFCNANISLKITETTATETVANFIKNHLKN